MKQNAVWGRIVAGIMVAAGLLLARADAQEPVLDPNGGGAPTEANEPTQGLSRNFRISAIAGSEDAYYVGMIDQATGESRLLRVGDVFYGYRVEEIRPDEQEVVIARDDRRYVMYLRGDATLVANLPSEIPAVGEVETDEDFTPPPEVRTLEDFLRENYELMGMESPDAPIPEEFTKPVTPEEALRRMAESVGLPVPEDALKPVTREEFLQRHGLDGAGETQEP